MLRPGLSETSALLAVIEQKSFAKAARQLGLSVPRVSELIRKLEDNLGVRLVERTTRSVAPTVAGERLFERLRPLLDDYDAAFEFTNEFRSKATGRLRLTAPPPAADFLLAPAIPRFLASYPDISLEISFDDTLTDIVAARFDAGIRIGERIARDMIAVRISDALPLVVAASPAYLAQRGEPRTLADLAGHDCIRIRFSGGTFVPWRFRVKRREVEAHVVGRLIVNSLAIVRQAALDGLALMQVPSTFIASELAAGRLVTVLDEWAPAATDGFFLYYPSRRQMRPALKALVDFLRQDRRSS
jgi:DNA-binding transcriptional LysR family regulator